MGHCEEGKRAAGQDHGLSGSEAMMRVSRDESTVEARTHSSTERIDATG